MFTCREYAGREIKNQNAVFKRYRTVWGWGKENKTTYPQGLDWQCQHETNIKEQEKKRRTEYGSIWLEIEEE